MDASRATSSGFCEGKAARLSDYKCVPDSVSTSLVLRRFLSLFDLLLRLCNCRPGFGLIGACLVEFFVPSLLLFTQSSDRSSESCDFFRILFEILLNAEQFEEKAAKDKVILRIPWD
jgi:hypothetical protein